MTLYALTISIFTQRELKRVTEEMSIVRVKTPVAEGRENASDKVQLLSFVARPHFSKQPEFALTTSPTITKFL
jgi:hypothetical protein